ncbi:MAG TPA: hypothetical protein VHR45_00095 [Thermoanaerobaculia bacterium]|nr:hypothetical protein [Thermoanaerobaculia bacterium]
MGKPQVEGHWHSLIEDFATSSLDFYELVKAGIARREIPDLKISQVEWKESGLGSGKRSYLRVSREGLNFDICAAPFGTGYFFSWWLAKIPRVLLDFAVLFGIAFVGLILFAIAARQGCGGIFMGPILFFGMLFGLGFLVRYGEMGLEPTVLSMRITGFFYGLIFRPTTYFNEDTAIMFQESVHNAVIEAIDQVTTAQGVRGLSEEARKITFKPRGMP